MNIDWNKVGAVGSVIGGIAVMHGLTTRKWRYIHTFGVILGILAAVAPHVKRKSANAAQAGVDPQVSSRVGSNRGLSEMPKPPYTMR